MPASGRKATLWRISTPVSAECEDAISEGLSTVFSEPPSVYSDAETQRSIADVYVRKKPSQAQLNELKRRLNEVRRAGLSVPPGRVTLARVRPKDWANSWKRHFKPIHIGHRLLIRPSWIKRRPKKNQAVVVLDPGLSFGTGQHPTTRFCLEQIVTARNQKIAQSFLDIGAGSGILSISAAKLGYAPVHAIDFDPEAVRIGMENARTNGVQTIVRIRRMDVANLRPVRGAGYDLICANLIYDLLLANARRLAHCLRPDGKLVLAGILRSQFPRVCKAYTRLGFRLTVKGTEGEWQSGAFVRKKAQAPARSSQRAHKNTRKNP